VSRLSGNRPFSALFRQLQREAEFGVLERPPDGVLVPFSLAALRGSLVENVLARNSWGRVFFAPSTAPWFRFFSRLLGSKVVCQP